MFMGTGKGGTYHPRTAASNVFGAGKSFGPVARLNIQNAARRERILLHIAASSCPVRHHLALISAAAMIMPTTIPNPITIQGKSLRSRGVISRGPISSPSARGRMAAYPRPELKPSQACPRCLFSSAHKRLPRTIIMVGMGKGAERC